ncbi:hypothetical protein IJX73_03705 [bacterium]|nr:hypothetical protein [bacterium]
MIIDNNLIAYEYYKNQYVPKEVYTSGKKEETNLINKYSPNYGINAPVLTLEDDIINSEGYGLKRGFYSVYPDKYLDFLYLYQSGVLKAKVPVIKMEVFETNNPKQEKVKKMSAKKYAREQEKKYRKYLKGENPEEIEWSEVNIYRLKEKNSWIIIYNSNNLELSGLIKF